MDIGIPLDTSAEAAAVQTECYRSIPGGQKVEMMLAMSEEAWRVSAAGVRARHPEYSEEDAIHAVRRMIWGDALYRGAYPQRPLLDP